MRQTRTFRRLAAAALCLSLGVGLAAQQAVAQGDHGTSTALDAAIASVGADGIVDLAGGDYGAVSLRGLAATADRPLVLRSADPANPARFARLMVQDTQNLVLEGLVFDYVFTPGDDLGLRPFQVLSSSNITIRDSLFDGDLARGSDAASNGFPTGSNLFVRWSRDVTLEDNEIRGFYRGMEIRESDGLTIRRNDIHSIRMDGMTFAQVSNVLIEANTIRDFARSLTSADHSDMIQFWTEGTTEPSRGIVIRNNILNSGSGWFTQSIFMRNELVDSGRAGPEMFYRDITLENNFILNAHSHGITLGETDGLRILNNTLVRNARSAGPDDNPGLWTPQIRVAARARNVEILRNVTSAITGPGTQSDWSVADNVFVQDRGRLEPGYYGTVFDDDALRDPTRVQSFLPRSGGPLDGTGLGASLARP